MSAKTLLTRLAAVTLGCLSTLSTFSAFAQTPTSDQIQAFKNLPQDQQQALMQAFLGSGTGGSGNGSAPGVTQGSMTPGTQNQQLQMPPGMQQPTGPIIIPRVKTWDDHYLRQPNEDPELRADDTIMLDLVPLDELPPCYPSTDVTGTRGAPGSAPGTTGGLGNLGTNLSLPGQPPLGAANQTNANAGMNGLAPGQLAPPCNPKANLAQNPNNPSGGDQQEPQYDKFYQFGADQPQEDKNSPQYKRELDKFRKRIMNGNPYKLDRNGALDIPGLPAIPLAGLTQYEAGQRLSGDPNLREFHATVTLLRLEPTGQKALKPFGYDLFDNPPSTFAPVTNIPVPPNYVIGPGDSFDVQLFGNEPQNYTIVVQRDGRVNFPKIGPIMVSGMSFDAARSMIERRVAHQLIGTRVSITMSDLRTIQVFVLGQAKNPGSYTIGGLSTITNALFASGGVDKSGSLRNIELKRGGRLVGVFDLYDLLLHGDNSGDLRLQSDDVIFIPPIGRTAGIDGEVRRPAIYELKSENTIGQLIDMAGGLLPDADQTLVHVERIAPSRMFQTLDLNLTAGAGRDAPLADGDKITVPMIRPTLEASVEVAGYVFRPGAFEYHPGLRLSDVIPSFDELKPDADPHYIMIRRIVPPNDRVEVVSADLQRALAARGTAEDPPLEPRDKIYVFDLSASRARIIKPILKTIELQATPAQPAAVVSVDGQVKAPGQYALEPGMRVSDLIRAGGSLDDAAFGGEAELTRYSVVSGKARESRLIKVDLDAIRRGDASADLQLQPYDVLVVKTVPQWTTPGTIVLAGEVRFPGRYPIHQGETLRSALVRAGGFTENAFPDGAVFTREELKQKEKAELDLLANRFQDELSALSLRSTAGAAIGTAGSAAAASSATQGLIVGQQLMNELRTTKPVGRLVINLDRIMRGRNGGPGDVLLRDGDLLFVPKKTQEITILGEVQNPTSQIFQPGLSREDYIRKSGGVTQNADRKRIYVVRANGDVVGTARTGWFRRSQDIAMRPGDTIVVPLDAERVPALPMWAAATQILYNIAIAVLALHNL